MRAGIICLHTSPLDQPGEGDSGGMNVYVHELAGSLARAGLDVDVFVRRNDPAVDEVVEVEPGLRVVHLDAGPHHLPKELLPQVLDVFESALWERLSAEPVDVLHANYWLSAEVGHRIKHRLMDERGHRVPLVVTFHTLARVKSAGGDDEPESRARAEAAVVGCADAVCAATPEEARELIDLYGAVPERVEFVVPGVDHAFFSPGDRHAARHALGLGDEPTALFVGRIQPLKGVDLAVQAIAASTTPDASLVVIGGPSGRDGGSELCRVRELASELGVADRVTWVSPQPHHLLSTWYRAADVALVPSRSESFGLVALEASACGTPVLASAVGGLTMIVDDGVTGRLLERDPVSWARAMDELWSDPVAADRMAYAAARRARRFSWALTAGRLRRLYSDLANAPVLVSCTAGR